MNDPIDNEAKAAPSPGAAAAADQSAEERRTRRRNVVTVSMPDALMGLADATGRDPGELASAILAEQSPILAAKAANALRAVLP
jgi:hypothetical protein